MKASGALLVMLVVIGAQTQGVAFASDRDGNFQNLGSGNNSCGTIISDVRKNNSVTSSKAWMLGFLTGYNIFLSRTGNVSEKIDNEALWQWVLNWCGANPLENLAYATQVLIDDIEKRAKKR